MSWTGVLTLNILMTKRTFKCGGMIFMNFEGLKDKINYQYMDEWKWENYPENSINPTANPPEKYITFDMPTIEITTPIDSPNMTKTAIPENRVAKKRTHNKSTNDITKLSLQNLQRPENIANPRSLGSDKITHLINSAPNLNNKNTTNKNAKRTKSVSPRNKEKSPSHGDSISQLSHRDPLLTSRREKKIEQVIEQIPLKFLESLKAIEGTPAENFDIGAIVHIYKKFKKWKKQNPIESEFNGSKLNNIIERIMKDEISGLTYTKKNQTCEAWLASNFTRTSDLVEIVQYSLIPMSPIYKKLKVLHSSLYDYMSASKEKVSTVFTKCLYEKLNDLTDILKEKNETLPRGKHIGNYLWINKKSKETQNLSEIETEVRDYIVVAFGDNKSTRKEIFNLLEDWNNSSAKVEQIKGIVREWTFKSIDMHNVFNIMHIWDEAIHYEDRPKIMLGKKEIELEPIDKILIYQIIESFIYNNIIQPDLITINGEVIFDVKDKKSSRKVEDSEKFLLNIFVKLYKAFGYDLEEETDKTVTLKGQVRHMLLACNKKYNGAHFTDKTLHCLRILAMGCCKSWQRAECYFGWRFEKIFNEKDLYFTEGFQDGVECNFQIKNVNDYHAEIIRNFAMTSSATKERATFPVSWKVCHPLENRWSFNLKIHQFLNKDLLQGKTIEPFLTHMVDFTQNSKIQKNILKDTVSISYILKTPIRKSLKSKKSIKQENKIEAISLQQENKIEVKFDTKESFSKFI